MKKYILSMIIGATIAYGVSGQTFVSGTSSQTRDRVRISYIGFNCTNETEDNTLETDGKGDEIFVLCNWIMADKNNNSEFNGKYRSPMQGDVNGHYGWIQAGSRSDKGGIRSGDQFRGNMTMGEFDISDGEILTVTPTIWEWDGNSDAVNTFQGVESGHENQIKNVSFELAKGMVQMADPIAGMQFMISHVAKGISAFAMAVNDIMGQAKDRPIGMDASGRFSPKSIVLTRDMMRKITQRNLGYGMGVVQLDYDELKLGNTRDHGAYTLLIKLEYLGSTNATGTVSNNTGSGNNGVPSHTTVPPPSYGGTTQQGGATHASIPPPSNSGAQMGNAGNGSMPIQTSNGGAQQGGYVAQTPSKSPASSGGGTPMSLDGYWLGAFYNGPDVTPEPFNFLFNRDGSLKYLDRNLGYKSKGTYLISYPNRFQGRFDSPAGGGRYISFIGILNGNQLSGTWGYGSNVSDGGKWSTTKK